MDGKQDKIREIAILISSLDSASADALLDKMTEEESDLVRTAILELGGVSTDEEKSTIARFLSNKQSEDSLEQDESSIDDELDGVELEAGLLEQLEQSEPEPPIEETASEAEVAFRFVHQADTETLARLLANEHPQTVAVVLSHISPDRAGEILVRLPHSIQSVVIRRIAQMDNTDPAVLRTVEQTLDNLLADHVHLLGRRGAGVDTLDAILDTISQQNRNDVLGNLAETDARLAKFFAADGKQVRTQPPLDGDTKTAQEETAWSHERGEPQTARSDVSSSDDSDLIWFEFDELKLLDNESLATLIRHADPQICILALTGAPLELVNRIMNQLPERTARKLQRQMQKLGPLLLEDVDMAQRELANLASQLARLGELAIPANKRFSIAV